MKRAEITSRIWKCARSRPLRGATLRGATLWLLGLCGAWLVSGCSTPVGNSYVAVTAYKPSNVYRAFPVLPLQVRRVAVLPVTSELGDWQAEAGQRELSPVLQAELGKVKAFERVLVTPEQLEALTGKPAWRAEDKLPANFFEKLRDALGCDAVLFAQLRPYHAYKPMVVGWNLKLVEVQHQVILWAVDEVFDAGKPSVAKAALGYWRQHVDLLQQDDPEGVLISPRRFGQYTLCALLETIPPR